MQIKDQKYFLNRDGYCISISRISTMNLSTNLKKTQTKKDVQPRLRTESESSNLSNMSTGSKFSTLSNVSSLVSGGVFQSEEQRESLLRSEDMEKIGPEMGHIRKE